MTYVCDNYTSYSAPSRLTLKIPCSHIFAVREEEITLLSNEDIPERWTMAYFKQFFGEKGGVMDSDFSITPVLLLFSM